MPMLLRLTPVQTAGLLPRSDLELAEKSDLLRSFLGRLPSRHGVMGQHVLGGDEFCVRRDVDLAPAAVVVLQTAGGEVGWSPWLS